MRGEPAGSQARVRAVAPHPGAPVLVHGRAVLAAGCDPVHAQVAERVHATRARDRLWRAGAEAARVARPAHIGGCTIELLCSVMAAMSSSLSDADIAGLAAYYARQRARAVVYVPLPRR